MIKKIKDWKSFNENNTDNLLNHGEDYLVEDKWKNKVPENITIKRNNESAEFSLRDKVKNMNSIILTYNLEKSTTNTFANTLTISISFKEKNTRIDMPLEVEFESVVEVTLGTLYVLSIKIYNGNEVKHYIEQKAEIDAKTKTKISKLIEYVTGVKNIKI